MRPRISNTNNNKAKRQLVVDPFLALACEGETEEIYAKVMGRGRHIRVKPKVFGGYQGIGLVDEALAYAAQMREQLSDEVEVIPAVIYDIERVSDKNLNEARAVVEYANRKGVLIWVNMPTIERWFTLHHRNVSPFRSVKQVEIELNKALKEAGLSLYKKPGSIQFHTGLRARSGVAAAACARSHTDDMNNQKIPCLCNFVTFLGGY